MFLLIILVTIASVHANKNLCDTKDSVDITNGELLSNGTILSNGILYPPKHVYFNNETLRTYGCVCKVKNCVRKCCSIGSVMYMNSTFKSCAYLPDEGIMMNRGFNLHYVNRVKKNVKLNDSDFGYVYGKPCDDVYLEDKSWFLQEKILNIILLITAFVIYYSLLAAFFWLNVMCFDIWWTFSGKRGKSLEKMSLRTRFVAYSLYAFGIPTVLTALLVGLEFSGLPPHPLLPMIRQQGCFIYGNNLIICTSKLIYLYGPISILCIANMTFFVLTAVKIAQIKKQTSVLKSKDSSTHDQHRNDRQRLLLYIKLLAVMGVSWILEVVSAIYPEAEDIWKFTDAYNVLIGLIIFIIFVCKRKIFRLIKKRFVVFRRSNNESRELKEIVDKRMRRWQNNSNQRASLETIRTSIGVDSDATVRNTTNV
uniref:Methuselah-like protein 10 n=1 Tax=Bombyx mori TaxID=7091 RepID=J7ET58_BOMMO|nr:methuselah-like protein 10 [Bombyx mori]